MKSVCKFLGSILLIIVLTLGTSYAKTPNGNYITIYGDFLSATLFIHYGSGKTETISMKPEEKLSARELFDYKYNTIVDVLNKLEKEGYKVVSTVGANTSGGSTQGCYYVLYKAQ